MLINYKKFLKQNISRLNKLVISWMAVVLSNNLVVCYTNNKLNTKNAKNKVEMNSECCFGFSCSVESRGGFGFILHKNLFIPSETWVQLHDASRTI